MKRHDRNGRPITYTSPSGMRYTDNTTRILNPKEHRPCAYAVNDGPGNYVCRCAQCDAAVMDPKWNNKLGFATDWLAQEAAIRAGMRVEEMDSGDVRGYRNLCRTCQRAAQS